VRGPGAHGGRRRDALGGGLQELRDVPGEDDGVLSRREQEVVAAQRERRRRLEVSVPRQQQPPARDLPQVELAGAAPAKQCAPSAVAAMHVRRSGAWQR